MKKTYGTIKMYDYSSWEELKKDIPKMEKKGYQLIDKNSFGFGEPFYPHETTDTDNKVIYISASFIKSEYI